MQSPQKAQHKTAKDKKLAELARIGQSVWLDYIDRPLLETGGLARLIEQGVTGVTTNPSIFHKAISGGADYDADIRRWLAAHPDGDPQVLLEALMIEDVRRAADLLAPVYQATQGADGFVSLEVSPLLAHDTEATITAARRLWQTVARDNLMIKIPATAAGLPAIERCLADGIPVNVTLIFSVPRYAAVLAAHNSALAQLSKPDKVASVASFFISRIDSALDPVLAAHADARVQRLCGRIATASAQLAYAHLCRDMASGAFSQLAEKGARPQRLLWGSTGTKNSDYSDVLYVDGLIAPDTVNTLPPATLAAFLDHGTVARTLADTAEQAAADLALLSEVGISLAAVTADLEQAGVAAFVDAHQALLDDLAQKMARLRDRC
jgi:transaldolase